MTIEIRPEIAADIPAIWVVEEQAFARPDEANLVDSLRQHLAITLSLVAVVNRQVVGHICFSPVRLQPPAGDLSIVGLGPIAVLPAHQNQGIGSNLIWTGLAYCREQGQQAVVVLGHPTYYPRFGFIPAGHFGLRSTYNVPNDLFMAQELQPGSLSGRSGVIHYRPEFAAV